MQRAVHDITPFREARLFALLLEEHPDDALFLSREALRSALQQHAGAVITLPPPNTQQMQKWSTLLAPPLASELPKTLLSIAKTDCPIESIHYDETDAAVSIVITPSREPLRREHIAITPLLPEPDIVIAFAREERLPQRHLSQFTLPTEDRVYLLGASEPAALEAYHALLAAFPESLNAAEVVTLLLASLLSETKNLTQNRSQSLLSVSADLLGRGANIQLVESLLAVPVTQTQLLGRALARTTMDAAIASSWTFLAQKDFEKTGSSPSPSALRDILSEITARCKTEHCALLLWQEQEGVRAMVRTRHEGLRKVLAAAFAPTSTSPDVMVFHRWKNFSEAERELRHTVRLAQNAQQETRQPQDSVLSSE